jgi:hypothetical protein
LFRGEICGASLVQESMLIARHPHSAHADNGDAHAGFPGTVTARVKCQCAAGGCDALHRRLRLFESQCAGMSW